MPAASLCVPLVLAQAAQAAPADPQAASPPPALSSDQVIALVQQYGVPVLKAVVLLIVGYWISVTIGNLVRRACDRAKLDITLGRFLGSLVRWGVLAAVVITCLSAFGVQVTSFVALLGSIGVAIGLALQGSLSHIASGVLLLIFRPFKVGDSVTAGGVTGIVNEINLFSTELDTPDNRRIIVPNGGIINAVITNATYHPVRVVDVTLQIDAGADVERVRSLLIATATAVPGRAAEKPVNATLTALAATETWTVSMWARTGELDAVRERLLIACTAAVAREKLAPAAPVALVRNV